VVGCEFDVFDGWSRHDCGFIMLSCGSTGEIR
jgi:hypothetical protein